MDSPTKMHIFESHYFKYTIFFYKIIGFWPYQPLWQRLPMYVINMIMSAMALPSWCIRIFNNRHDVATILTILPGLLVEICTFIFIANLFIRWKLLRMMFDEIGYYWTNFENDYERQVSMKFILWCKKLNFATQIVFHLAGISFLADNVLPTILDEIKPLEEPRPKYFFVTWMLDTNLVFASFWDIVIAQTGAIYFESIVTMANICMFYGFTTNSLVVDFLKELGEENLQGEELNSRFRKISYRTQRGMRFYDCSNRYFQYLLVTVILLCIMLLSISLFGIVASMESQPEKIPQIVIFFISPLYGMFVCCLLGEGVLTLNEMVLNSLYETPWYEWPLKLRQNLMIYRIRVRKPLRMVTIGTGCLSCEYFVSILNASFSYFTVFRSMH